MQREEKKRKSYDFANLPMDLARVVCVPLLLLFRMKRLTPEGQPYRDRIRGGAILAANHRTFADPFLLGVAVWYRDPGNDHGNVGCFNRNRAADHTSGETQKYGAMLSDSVSRRERNLA